MQKTAARFVTGNYTYETGSMAGVLEQLKWESLKKRRKDSRLIMLYKALKGVANIPTSDLVPQTDIPGIIIPWNFKPHWLGLIFMSSFFPQTIRDWNSLTDSLISASECAENQVTKFTFLVMARD